MMKYIFAMLFLAQAVFAGDLIKPSVKNEQVVATNEGIDFKEWESQFDSSMEKAKVRVQHCESKSKNCQFEKFQALDPSFDMVH